MHGPDSRASEYHSCQHPQACQGLMAQHMLRTSCSMKDLVDKNGAEHLMNLKCSWEELVLTLPRAGFASAELCAVHRETSEGGKNTKPLIESCSSQT